MAHVTLSKVSTSHFYQVQDERSYPTTCCHRVLACLHHLRYAGAWRIDYLRSFFRPEEMIREPTVSSLTGRYDMRTLPWNDPHCKDSDGLCLFLHGLKASAKQWEAYTRQFSTHFPNTHYIAGSVFERGNCFLEEAGDPFIELIEDYLQKFPGKSIILIGTSNGSRIASYIEVNLKPELLKNSQLKVFSIAGVHGGTVLIDLAHRMGCAGMLGLHPAITSDFSCNSERTLSLVSQWRERQKIWQVQRTEVSHHFFITTEDELVRPLSSSFPRLKLTPLENYHVVHGESHETIVDGVQPQIFDLLKQKTS
jgi:hypothetical protein